MSIAIHANPDETRQREQIVEFGRSLFERGLTAGSSGNLSVRLDDGWLLTPTNASLGRLDPARLSKLDWDGRLLSGERPSKEAFLHRAMYQRARRRRRDRAPAFDPFGGGVLHVRPERTTTAFRR